MLSGMTSSQLAEWSVFFEVEEEKREERKKPKPKKAKQKDKVNIFKAWFAPKIKKAEK